jgi:surfactin synthase thioesterase subunit
VTAIVGDEDPKTSLEEALAWEDHTRGGFDLQVLPGGHFYLTNQQTEVMRLLSDHFASTAVSGRPS